jgi:hypothetical protein
MKLSITRGPALITCLTASLGGVAFAITSTVNDDGKANFDHIHVMVDTFGDSGNFITPLDQRTQGACIASNERIIANEAIADYKKKNPNRSDRFIPGVLTFFPMGGRLYHDIFTTNFVDLDPSSGLLDWDCTNCTYDEHKGNDTGLKTFTEQIIGVPAFSAMDGIVVYAHDGEPDMNTDIECQGIGNAVIVDHGNDLYGYYWHFKNGSVSVAEGEVVTAGQQIAEIASSGCSTGPHLHFELRNHEWFEGETIEPYIGECHLGESMWEEQVEIERALYFEDYGIARTPFNSWPSYPYRYPNDHQFLLSDSHQYYWILMHNLPAKGAYSWKWYKPDGTLSHQYNAEYDNEVLWRSVIWRSYWNISDMHQYPGTWHVTLDFNGTILDMYPEIVEELDTTFNNAPNPIQIEVQPIEPFENDVLECNVLGSLTNDDPERDVVRYRYLWKVNDTVVRDTVSAAKKDVLAWDIALAGDNVTVSVTPNDGYIDGSTSNLEVTVAAHQTIWTVAPNGTADFADLQSAVDAASDGDEIIVAPGTYTNTSSEVVNMLGKEIWLRSSGGAAVTIINGEDTRRGIYCATGETAKTIVEGFTITNGYTEDHGGGMRNNGGSPTLTDCIFQNNYATLIGGGLFSSQGSPTLRNCTFAGNFCVYGGGGMRTSNGNPTLENCIFTGNDSAEYGGGMNCSGGDATIINCIFQNNTASYGGGGIRSWNSSPTLTGTTVCNNTPNQITGSYTDGGENTIADVCPIDCASDINVDGNVNIHDLLIIINDWGACNDNCASDVNDDGEVDVNDLIILIDNWGPCE